MLREVPKERKKSTTLTCVTFLRTIPNLVKLLCYLNSKHESFVCVFFFFLRDLFLHYIIITIFINSSKLSTLLVLMKINLHWRRECLHVKSKPAIYNVCYLIKLNNILFCIATLQSRMKQPSFHLKLSWAFTCTESSCISR